MSEEEALHKAEEEMVAGVLRLGDLKEEEWPLFVQSTGKLADPPESSEFRLRARSVGNGQRSASWPMRPAW